MPDAVHDAMDRQAAEALHYEIVPGTEVMTDVGDVRFAHANRGAGSVLIPHPSNDPRDPLNWSYTWKVVTATAQLLYVWILVSGALSLAPLFPQMGAEFDLDNQQLSFLTGINVLTLGFANIFLVPLSNIFGRRPVSIICGIFVMLTNMWQALATSHSSLLAARACNGIASATSETIMVQVIADMFFLHERAFWMGLYFTFYFAGTALGPIMSGSIGGRYGWRSFEWLATALAGFVTLLLVVAFPETKWHRSGHIKTTVTSKEGGKNEGTIEEAAYTDPSSNHLSDESIVGSGSPSKMQFSPLQKPDRNWLRFVVRDLTAPVIVSFNPIVLWAALILAGAANLLLMFNVTESDFFGVPPYNWSTTAVGYSNFAFCVGGIIGVLTAGPFSDWWARRATIRNNGIREPEMRLPPMIPYVALFVIACVTGALGYQNIWPWQAVLVCGYGFAALATSIPTIALAYAIDCYKPISGEIMTVATVAKNTLGFALTYWIFTVQAEDGWIPVFMTQFATAIVPMLLTIPLYFWGKKLRRWTKDSSLHRMEGMI